MSDIAKVQQNFNAPVSGVAGNVEGDMIVHAPAPQVAAASQKLTDLLTQLRQKYPTATDEQLFDRLINGFQQMPQTNLQNWQRWQDTFSVLFAGGIEATKILVPVAGIPIEVLKRLYEIYDRNRRQLPGA
ncbi:MAG: hypothetical protein KME13_01785 [Myxacorys californica WJT36-NPBG1]|jgi:hypothetical protein|nr:hypothetical protein [Myxacorys californica WJT36-NPBG1]